MKTYDARETALDLAPCSYGVSRLTFRGPRRPTDGSFLAFLGGSDTFARYVPEPYSDLIEAATGRVCVNLGCQAAGPDVYLKDTAIQSMCHDACATIIQVIGAVNLTNEYYKVHPRRNDRFIGPTDRLKSLFPEIDFTEISFTGHLISRLRAVDEARFSLVRVCLQATWQVRMEALIQKASGPVFLLWFTQENASQSSCYVPCQNEALFVTEEMVATLRGGVAEVVKVKVERGKVDGLSFAQLDFLAARDSLDAPEHRAVAEALIGPLERHLS